MIPMVFSLEEAKEWFLNNSTGCVKCVAQFPDREKVCRTYPEAKAFYEGK